ncbi:hypothetical protein FK178_08905 [Antarcticibacterium arcticum]|uniref:Four helix bundle protein n=1 Tax=Antarcticibacterium arcticum TaxID=2585771 RepID=A0A5B8YMH1_9FLAO|nr:hypothetical protein [Antarcticibacterium arcticum]QED37833.1 hypothetical protein FK178_08905 [Antarcticibacterium arcticum]
MESSNFTQLAIYRKALEIFNVSRGIACAISDNKHILEMGYAADVNQQVAGEIVTDSLRLMPELAAIQNASNSIVRLRRARKIRRSAQQILAKCKRIEYSGMREKEFIGLLKTEIQLFDRLFLDWLNKLQLNHNSN